MEIIQVRGQLINHSVNYWVKSSGRDYTAQGSANKPPQHKLLGHAITVSQQTQNIFITFVQRRPNVFDVCPTLYKCYTNGLCLLGSDGDNTAQGSANKPTQHKLLGQVITHMTQVEVETTLYRPDRKSVPSHCVRSCTRPNKNEIDSMFV